MSIDSLDIEQPDQIVAYLRETGRIARDEAVHTRVLAGGVSNKTVLVERPSGEAWVLKQALPKLRVAVDWFSDPARIGREALGLRYLEKLAPPGTTTPLVFEDPRHYLLAMRAVPRPHENWKTMLLAGRVEEDHVTQFGTLLGTIHRRSWEQHDRESDADSGSEMSSVFADRSFFESLRVEPYYQYTASVVPESADFYNDLVAVTRALTVALVHGDYSPKNILVHEGRLVLLDHEVIHWGDPAFDAGFAMAHLLSKAHHCAADRARFAWAAVKFGAAYLDALGDVRWFAVDFPGRWVRHTLGCLLARVAGRSPLEYLSPNERRRQWAVVLKLMHRPPNDVAELATQFVERVGAS
jgi:tRNA A-37 threonylcarbamoyl transferase component Bud32